MRSLSALLGTRRARHLLPGLGALLLALVAAPPVAARGPGPSPSDSLKALLPSMVGISGKLRALLLLPAGADADTLSLFQRLFPAVAAAPGRVHDVGLTTDEGQPVVLLALLPFSAKRGAVLDGYRIGFWPGERSRRRGTVAPATPLPQGFIEVTPATAATAISAHFTLADFLTHDQSTVWPKYLVLEPRLIDKLELIADELAARGLPSAITVMSGFRTPQYNARGAGRRGGRAKDSRHMYGDAADIFVDADGDGRMDDLDGDGRSTQADARLLLTIAESVEATHPELTGGLSAYKPTRAHGSFLHVDTRGTPARW